MDNQLLQLLFPAGLVTYFRVTSYKKTPDHLWLYLEEKNISPKGYSKKDLESKGFYEEETVADFPLQGKPCSYKIKRRKWKVKATGQIINRDWNLVAEGTRITSDFATFLKGTKLLSAKDR